MTVKIRILKNVLAIPSKDGFNPPQFLCDINGSQIDGINNFCDSASGKFSVFRCMGTLPDVEETIDEGVFGGWIWPFFSHFMFDVLPRIWYQRYLSDEKTYFFDISSIADWYTTYPKQPPIIDLGKVFDADLSKFELIRKPTFFKKLCIPDPVLLPDLKPKEQWFDFLSQCKWFPTSDNIYKKVYIPRVNIRGTEDFSACFFGEPGFIEYLKSEGFYILDVFSHSVSDQWFIIRNADVVLIPEGSGILWSLFCEKTKMIIISRRPERLCKGIADITTEIFGNIAKSYVDVSIIDHVIGFIDSRDCFWSNKSVFVDWKKISIDLKILGLVSKSYNENESIKEDIERFKKIYPFSSETEYQVEKNLIQIDNTFFRGWTLKYSIHLMKNTFLRK